MRLRNNQVIEKERVGAVSDLPAPRPGRTGSPAAMRLERDVVVLAIVFAMLTVWSWLKWPDPLIDFGRELYTPWQLSSGKVLYRDVASLFGPFSQYFNAILFQVFGASLRTLVIANLIIFAMIASGIHHLVTGSSDRVTASWATLTTLAVFGFSQYVTVGNYNFITPYSHEASHSIALSIAILVCLVHGVRTRGIGLFAAGGLLFGLLLLTKAETCVAMMAAVAVAFPAWWIVDGENRRLVFPSILAFLGCAAIAPLAFWLFLSSHMSTLQALRGLGSSWWVLLATNAAQNEFYIRVMGFRDPGRHAIEMLRQFSGFLIFVFVVWQLDTHWLKFPALRSFHPNVLGPLARMSLLLVSFALVPWDEFPSALPLITACSVAILAVLFYRARHDRERALKLFPQIVWAVFSLVLLSKIILNVRLYHYGFYLALPATVLLVVMLVYTIPSLMVHRGARGHVFRSVSVLMLIAGIGMHVAVAHSRYSQKRYSVGSGADRFLAFDTKERWEARAINDVVSRIQANVPKEATMVVFPEGVMINYLSRHNNPTPYISFMLPELRAFGEDRMLQSLDAAAPDYALLVYRDTTEYGVRSFGRDPEYGQSIMKWLDANYVSVFVTGDRPVREGGLGIEILRRNR